MNNDVIIVWNELNSRLIHFINQKVKDSEVAKDISQDVFVKVFTKIDSLKKKDKIIPWIYQITRNEINSYFRKQKNGDNTVVVSHGEEVEEDLIVEFSKCVEPMINALPSKYQEAIRLTEIEGVSQKEWAEIANISYSGAKSRVQRGRVLLKSLLQDCCEVSTDVYGNVTNYKNNSCNSDC